MIRFNLHSNSWQYKAKTGKGSMWLSCSPEQARAYFDALQPAYDKRHGTGALSCDVTYESLDV